LPGDVDYPCYVMCDNLSLFYGNLLHTKRVKRKILCQLSPPFDFVRYPKLPRQYLTGVKVYLTKSFHDLIDLGG
jgi:hypothetical protein